MSDVMMASKNVVTHGTASTRPLAGRRLRRGRSLAPLAHNE